MCRARIFLQAAVLSLLANNGLAAEDIADAPQAAAEPTEQQEVFSVPRWTDSFTLASTGKDSDILLLGVQNEMVIDFGLRKDRIVGQASLDLNFTPSPALIPGWSHLRVYLNDVLMGTVSIEQQDLGQATRRKLELNSFLLSDFNRVRIEFVGHYTDVCEDPANNTLWVNIGRDSRISLDTQAVATRNNLAFFPLPFFDANDREPARVHMIFPGVPDLLEQQAAGIMASFFGSQSGWRGSEFPVLYNALPDTGERRQIISNSLVFATNDRRPDFLSDKERYPDVEAPVIQLLDHPDHPYSKLLVLMGRDGQDLQTAARALATRSPLLRGSRVVINKLQELEPRKPYDAPNWVPTDRLVRFAELVDYPGQLQVKGMRPDPVRLELNLPPDLFVWRNQGIPLTTRYRYTMPLTNDESRLSLSINDQFIASMPLSKHAENSLEKIRLGIMSSETANTRDTLLLPSLKLGAVNSLRYDFSFSSTFGGAQKDYCQTVLPVDVRAVIDEDSTIDFSGYYHYMAMPDLRAFASSGFPFSRMADLSETRVVMPPEPAAMQLSTLLQVLGNIGAKTGYPALALQLTDDWQTAKKMDADLLVLAGLAPEIVESRDLNLLLEQSRDRLLQGIGEPMPKEQRYNKGHQPAHLDVDLTADAPIAAIVGLQSPFHAKRSVVALLATSHAGFDLLGGALRDQGKLAAVAGSAALIRESGVHSQLVGDQYYVGYVPWWIRLWYVMSEHPLVLLLTTLGGALLVTFVLWQLLRWQAARRLRGH